MKRPVLLALAVSGIVLAAALLAGFVGSAPNPATAASHREAPLISLDPAADNTDTFFFRSYEPGQGDKIVMVMNVIPNEEPSSGPNYYNFDPNVRYAFNIDNDQDGKAEDVVISFDFKTEIRGVVDALGLPLSYIGGAGPVPPITALDGPGSEGLGLRQRYSVTVENEPRGYRTTKPLREDLIAVPSNVGPRTMPDYDALAAQGIYDLGNGIRVFAGQRNDPFYIDVGAAFDTLNLRRFPPLLTAIEDANDNLNPFGFDQLSGFSVHTIAIEMPASMLTSDGKAAEATSAPKLGLYASTRRPTITIRNPAVRGDPGLGGLRGTQVSRLANPLVNELIIATKDKDEWNASDPDEEEKFVGYYLKPRFALALQLATGFPTGCTPFGTPACSPSPPAPAADLALSNFNRDDLLNVLLKYAPSDTNLSELLRLDVSVDPVPLAQQRRLSILAGDSAGWPNGRRPKDDVTDIATRVVGGPLYIENRAGDGVNTDLSPLPTSFPFVPRPSDGRDLNPEPHVNPTP
jgi:Domain of unknown function (DUF4331)